MKEDFIVKIEDLSKGCHSLIEVKCDCEYCDSPIKTMTWNNYNNNLKESGKYFCQKCVLKLSSNKRMSTILKNGKSFEQWCIENNRLEFLNLWDYDLNDCKPCDITHSTSKSYYFKCPEGIHNSKLNCIVNFTGRGCNIKCDYCNSFEAWCINNLSKEDSFDLLSRWDIDKNKCLPSEISYSSEGINKKGYWFKCLNNISHESEQRKITCITNGNSHFLKCKKCNSFAQWGIDNLGEDFLEKYWNYEKNININPWNINFGSAKEVYIICQEKDYHGSYNIKCVRFTGNQQCRCNYCSTSSKYIHVLDSVGEILKQENKLHLWSDKNIGSAYEYFPYSVKEVYWKCNNNKHDDFKRKISYSTDADFNCPNCQIYKGEEKIKQYLKNNDIIFQFQKTFDNLLGLGNGLLSYDFYLPLYNLLIEVQGKQHEKPIEHFGGEKQFIIQQEHDRRKKQYSIDNNINLLEIWYWDFNRIDEILQTELQKYNSLALDKINKIKIKI